MTTLNWGANARITDAMKYVRDVDNDARIEILDSASPAVVVATVAYNAETNAVEAVIA